MLHHFEEPIISGECETSVGSGAIFFSGCNLRCEYCQNYELSHNGVGYEISVEQLAAIFKKLEEMGAYNINLVTPTHFADKIIEALKIYKPSIPIVWNTSGYERSETIEKSKGFVDIFLTDLKYFSPNTANLSCAPNYFEYASASIIKMREIVGEDVIKNGLMKNGVIVRHLVLPNCTDDSINVLKWVAKNLGTSTILSLMSQYVPMGDAVLNPLINRKIKRIEYNRVVNYALNLGLTNSYIQDQSSAESSYTPSFNAENNLLFKFNIVKNK